MKTLGACIRKRRRDLELTQAQLASKTGVSQNYITYLEKNERTPSNDIIKKLSHNLNLPLDHLYFLTHPDVEKMLPEKSKTQGSSMNPLLKKLSTNHALRKKHIITDEDIELLATIQGRGTIENEQDYVFLLMTIRQVFKE